MMRLQIFDKKKFFSIVRNMHLLHSLNFSFFNSNVVFQPFKTQSLELRLRLRCLIGKQTMQMTQAPYIMPFGLHCGCIQRARSQWFQSQNFKTRNETLQELTQSSSRKLHFHKDIICSEFGSFRIRVICSEILNFRSVQFQ